ncbi:hypothetical protein QYE76_013980 [Lolium multiflorum]|uniref:Reverse transcriptase domain-containing protein n=1 Tax=Lolium multiflorum TaxID=4521 RepID=A0AAD8U3P0_LOLMU|nr:hypothetical protein QYE76_013980 [Lolium multiflorum]
MQTVLVNIPFADLEALVDSAIQMEGKLNQDNENRKCRMMNQSGSSHTQKYRPSSSVGFTPRGNNNKPQTQNSRPGYQNRSGGNSKPGGYNNNNYNNNNYYNRAPPRAPNNNNNTNTNTAPRTGSNAIPMTKEARRRSQGAGWAHTLGRRGPGPGRPACGLGPTPLSPPFRQTLRPEDLSQKGYLAKSYSRLCGAENTREKRALRRAGNSLREGEIDAIITVIELDIIAITIIIISTIITAVITAGHRIAMDEVRKKLFSLSLSGKAAHWYKLLDNGDSLEWNDIVPRFYSKFYPPSEIHKDRNRIYNFWPHDGESIAQAWGRLKSLMLKCPIHELPGNVIIDNFYARLSFQDKTLLDTSCSGSFTRNKEEFKRDLLDRIQENTEGWENDKDRESGIIYDYKCIEAFMDTDLFRNMSATYGLDSQVAANLYKAFASHYELPKKNFDKYHEPYKDKIDSSINKCAVVETADHVIPEVYIEKTPFPAKMKEYSVINSAVHKSEKKPVEPEEQIKIEPAVAIVKDLVTENVEDGHIILCEDASNIVSHPNKPKQASVPMISVRIGDHCYYGLCDIGASVSAIPYELYTEIMHEIDSCELEDIDVVIQLANRETISPIGIVRDVEVLCEVFMDDFSVYGNSFDSCLRNLDKVLQRCEETNLVLNWEKCHFMVNEGIVLGHKISERGIEVDRAKVEAIEKMPYPRDVKDRKGADNPVADNLSRLENIAYDPVPVNDSFPNEQLAVIKSRSTMVSKNKGKGLSEEEVKEGPLPPALSLDSFPMMEEVLRVTDEFCDQYRALRREVEILQEENCRLRRLIEYHSIRVTRSSSPTSDNNESLRILVQNYQAEKLKTKELIKKLGKNSSPPSPQE